MTEIPIKNDEDLFALLEKILNKEDIDPSKIKFIGYPQYEITLRGEDFNGGIPTRVMPSLVEFQKNLRYTYSYLKYGEKRKLSNEERKETELVVYVDASRSSHFRADNIYDVLNQVIPHMTGSQIALTILGVAAFWAGPKFYKAYIARKIKEKELTLQLQLSEEETKRQKTLVDAMNVTPILVNIYDEMKEVHNVVAKSLADRDEIVFDNGETIEAGVIKKILRKEKEKAIKDKLDGNFKILSVVSGGVENGFKIKVQQDIEEGRIVTVMAPEGRLSDEQVNILKNSEWGKETLYMEIDVVKVGEEITDATLVKASIRNSE